MMIPIQKLAQRGFTLDRVPIPCGICGTEVMTYSGSRDVTCSGDKCRRVRNVEVRKREMTQALEALPEKLPKILKNRGMGPGELELTRSGVTPKLWDLCAPWIDDLMAQPENPSGGFGLLGGAGTGKTGILATTVMGWALISGNHYINVWGVSQPSKWAPLWVNWEAKLSEIRRAFGDGIRSGALLDELKEAPLLAIEDLGAEQAKEDSWGNTQLYEVLEARYSAGRAVLWTSNLSKVELLTRYGGRLVSRLMGLAPPLEVPADLIDRRFEAVRGRMARHNSAAGLHPGSR